MNVQRIGAGSISTTIPDGAVGPELFSGAQATPHISGDSANATNPTSDWCSSLVLNYFNNSTSVPLYADSIALRAHGTELQIGYQNAATYTDGPGLQVADNIKYEDPFRTLAHRNTVLKGTVERPGDTSSVKLAVVRRNGAGHRSGLQADESSGTDGCLLTFRCGETELEEVTR